MSQTRMGIFKRLAIIMDHLKNIITIAESMNHDDAKEIVNYAKQALQQVSEVMDMLEYRMMSMTRGYNTSRPNYTKSTRRGVGYGFRRRKW